MKHMKKAFGLSILAALTMMAMSATAAQALTLKVNGNKDTDGEVVTGTIAKGYLLVVDLKLEITCTTGSAKAELKNKLVELKNEKGEVIAKHRLVEGEGTATFNGCDVVGAEEKCTVNSPGQKDGTITAKGSGEAVMEGAKTYADLSSGSFSTIEIQGLCAAAETEETVSGSATLTLLNPEEELVTHNVEVDDKALFFGTDTAVLHNAAKSGPITGSVSTSSEQKWSITLP